MLTVFNAVAYVWWFFYHIVYSVLGLYCWISTVVSTCMLVVSIAAKCCFTSLTSGLFYS